jgi:putative copper export protein
MNRSPITVIVAALIIVVSMAFLFRWHVISSSIASGWCVFSLARTGHSFFRRGVLRWTEAILRALHRRVAGVPPMTLRSSCLAAYRRPARLLAS